ncbi:HAD-like domain-containing protein [Roridomyces roridus]|uniref:HAD-like domain-containing protein n=1 Tax=Roridomyces roridus TaxID=1738132 RepID=A0AAD7FB96_9AGAR|nr:HAD-like domain-containing protein [Roridomyces roridus]KAJ7613545.1 HAD-like domain-containing protein [Roridomyces roridus]
MSPSSFYADAVLFDMDGTLTDSIAAVEAAWGKVAQDIGQDPAYVIAATHGKRAIDNLAAFKPSIKAHEMDSEVTDFEETILYYADAYNTHGPGSRRGSFANTPIDSPLGSGYSTPALSAGSSAPSSRAPSMVQSRRPSFASRLFNMLSMTAPPPELEEAIAEEDEDEGERALRRHAFEAWQLEAQSVDRSVRILPGVKRVMDSIPAGRYAVATSGAKTYAHGCMTRVGITPPTVTITADDKRLKAGKPAPDPFLLAAKCLGFPAERCVVFEDSPSGIRAGVASGATVIAVCTSHERAKIEGCGAHYIVRDMEQVRVEWDEESRRLKFELDL